MGRVAEGLDVTADVRSIEDFDGVALSLCPFTGEGSADDSVLSTILGQGLAENMSVGLKVPSHGRPLGP